MTTVGFVGLGIMGTPMAANLLLAGHRVLGHDVGADRVEQLVAAGGEAAGSVAGATDADLVITMLPDSPHVEAVVLGPDGILEHAKPGQLLVDMSTIRPETSLRVAAEAATRGVRTLDAPVSGGERGAVEGTLSIMIGGAAEDVAAARPVLDVLGATVVHVGPSGAGQTVKAANQLVVAGTYALVAEAIVLLEASGVDAGRRWTCWPAGWPAAGSWSSSGPRCWPASSAPGSGSTCTTRTWASCWPRPGRPAWRCR